MQSFLQLFEGYFSNTNAFPFSFSLQKSSNPSYLVTVPFRASDGVVAPERTELRLTAYDMRERLTSTCAQLGRAAVSLGRIRDEGEGEFHKSF